MATQLPEAVFAEEYNEGLVHHVLTAYMAKARSGNSAQKTRSEVRGGGAKPWRQKGTGRARAGTIRSPLWRSGGVTFAKKKRDYSQKVNKKSYRKAMRSILSELNRQERVTLVKDKDINVDAPKTAKFVELLRKLDINRGLIITNHMDENLYLASRNVKNVAVIDANSIDPVSLVWADKIILTEEAAKLLEERLG